MRSSYLIKVKIHSHTYFFIMIFFFKKKRIAIIHVAAVDFIDFLLMF